MTWDFERRDDVLTVSFHMPVSEGWSELYDALKAELESGTEVVMFPSDLPERSDTTREVFQALVNYLVGSGVQVYRGCSA